MGISVTAYGIIDTGGSHQLTPGAYVSFIGDSSVQIRHSHRISSVTYGGAVGTFTVTVTSGAINTNFPVVAANTNSQGGTTRLAYIDPNGFSTFSGVNIAVATKGANPTRQNTSLVCVAMFGIN